MRQEDKKNNTEDENPFDDEYDLSNDNLLDKLVNGLDIPSIQKERMESSLIPDTTQYFRSFGLTPDRLDLAGPEALVMHPGPMNRGVEISDDMADHPTRCLVKKQVANGIPTRMAILDRAFSKK